MAEVAEQSAPAAGKNLKDFSQPEQKGALTIQSLLDAVRAGKTLELVEATVGEKLSMDSFNKVLGDLSSCVEQKTKEVEEKKPSCLNRKEGQLLVSLEAAIKKGEVDSRSSLGNKFRAEADVTGMSAIEMKKFMYICLYVCM